MSKEVFSIPQREATTNVQVGILLSIINTLNVPLFATSVNREPHHEKPELDGGCKASAETTFINVCDRLSELVKDDSRWSLEITRVLELQALKINQQHLEELKARTAAAKWLTTPSYKLQPEISRIQDGMFAVYLGSLDTPDTSLIAIGSTPEKAFNAFDELFAGQIPDEMVKYLTAKDQQINKQNEEIKNIAPPPVDKTSTSNPPQDETGGSEPF